MSLLDYSFFQIKLILTNKTKKNQEEIKSNRFKYMIAGLYKEGPVPEGMKLFTFTKLEWAKFKCFGPLPIQYFSLILTTKK